MTNKILFTLLFIFSSILVIGQQLPTNNQFVINRSSLIPALSGFSGNIESFLTYRQSWIGIEGAPKLALFNINGAIDDKMGLAFTFMTEKAGNFTQNYILATYSYHLFFSETTCLSAGITPMYYRNQLDFSTINSYGTQLDPMLQNSDNLSLSAFDIGISLAFNMGNLNVGISVPQTIGLTLKYDNLNSNFGMKRHYFAYSSYQFELSDWILEPIVNIRSTENSPVNYGGSLFVKYQNRIWSNIGYNANKSYMISAGVLSGNSLAISYSYEFGFSGIAASSIGTHEITIGFLIKPAQKFRRNATVFMPQESQIGTDPNLANKVATLDNSINQKIDQQQQNLQKQIDSLKQVIVNTPVIDTVDRTQHWLQRIVSQNITFGLMGDKIFSSSFSELDKYAKKLRTDNTLKIKVLVYTDNLFSEEVNKKLSQDRAKSVAYYLLSKPGIIPSQVEYEGMGDIDPIGDNTTPEGRERNNRVEFLFNKKIF